jgi:hypothetical protein
MRDNVFIANRVAGFVSRIKEDPTQPSIIAGNVITDSSVGIALGFELIRTDVGVCEDNLIINKKPGAGGSPALNINPVTREPFIAGDPPAMPASNARITVRNNIIYKFQAINAYLGSGIDLTMTGNTIVPRDGGDIINIVNGSIPTNFQVANHYGSNGSPTPFHIGHDALSFADWKSKVNDHGDENIPAFPDPTRDVASYMKSLNETATIEVFLTEARKLERGVDTSRFTAAALKRYLRAGFINENMP